MQLSERFTDLQRRIFIALPTSGTSILLRKLAGHLEVSSNQVRIQVRQLEALGYLSVEQADGYNAPLQVCLLNVTIKEKPNFDKWLFSARWH